MSPHSDNRHDDAEFEAFLRGEGELARALREVPQPAPSDALTAAILARAESDLHRSVPANDTVMPGAGTRPPQHFLRRARIPLAMAASFLLALALGIQWKNQHSPVQETVTVAAAPQAQAPAAAPAPAPSIPAAPQKSSPPTQIAQAPALSERPKKAGKPAVQVAADPPIAIAQADIEPDAGTIVTRSVPPADMPRTAPMPAPVPAPVPAPAPAATAKASALETIDNAAAEERAKEWIILIEELLKADLPREAMEQWKEFRKNYPKYPAPAKLAARMKALEQRQKAP